MRIHIAFLCAVAALGPTGCMAKRLSDGGATVTTVSRAPHRCERLGDVAGRSGGMLVGDMTSVRDLDLGARNDLRNRAAKLGADTVQIVHREGVTPDTFAGQSALNEVRFTGVAWRCGNRSAAR